MTPDTPDPDELAAKILRHAATVTGWMRHLVTTPDQVVEVRALKMHDGSKAASGGYTAAGTFRGDELELMVREAFRLSGLCQGVYFTLNPLKPARYVRQAPRIRRASAGELAHDHDVTERRWLIIDID